MLWWVVCPRRTFDCADARILRVAQSSHFDMLGVVIRTLRDLGPPA